MGFFTRSELELESFERLREMCLVELGIFPIGDPAYKNAWIEALLSFAETARQQMLDDIGYQKLENLQLGSLEELIILMGMPTNEQTAVIKMALDGIDAVEPYLEYQKKLLARFQAKRHLELAHRILTTLA